MVLNIDHFSIENHKPQKRIQLYKLIPSTETDLHPKTQFIFVIILRAVFHARVTDFSCLIDFFSFVFHQQMSELATTDELISPCACLLWEPKPTGKLQRPSAVHFRPLDSVPVGPRGFPQFTVSLNTDYTDVQLAHGSPSTVKPQQRLRKEEEKTRKFQVAAESKQQRLFWSNRFLVDENLEHKLHQKNSEKHLFR